MSHFNADFFIQNRRRLQAALPTDMPIVLTANGLLQRGADSPFMFAQDASFWYLTGIDEPDVTVVIDGDTEFLLAVQREGSRATFDGLIDTAGFSEISGIAEVLNETAGWKRLDEALSRHDQVASLAPPPAYIEQYGMYANPARYRLQERLLKHRTGLELYDLRLELAKLRMVKQPAELRALQQAIDITVASLQDAFAGKRTRYQHEYELEAAIAQGFRSRGAQGHSFDPIVAGGQRAVTLHNVANDSQLQPDELVVVDVGAEYNHYAADITRTIALQKPAARQQAVYDSVLAVQQHAQSLLQPGVSLHEYEAQVAGRMAKELEKLKLPHRPDDIRTYFPHATSHFLGLNVHDVGDYQQPLAEGVVMTVEPGIYIPEEGIGVRIEDDVLITARGATSLSGQLQRKLY